MAEDGGRNQKNRQGNLRSNKKTWRNKKGKRKRRQTRSGKIGIRAICLRLSIARIRNTPRLHSVRTYSIDSSACLT